jgi:putative ABC transport system permease protein
MAWMRFFRRRDWDAERSRELDAYLDAETRDNLARGVPPSDARTAAQRKLGNTTQVREEIYRMNTVGFLESLWQDLRFGVRLLRRSPGFTIVAIVSLALGIGANTAIFQLIDVVRLRTIPVEAPQRLVTVKLADRTGWRGSQANAYPALTNRIWEKLRDDQDIFSGTLAWASNNFGLTPGGDVHLAQGLFVSGDFFNVLGVRPLLGRVFTATDDRRGCGLPGAVVSYAFWQRELGGDPASIGRKLTLNYQPTEIIGVTPPGFYGLEVGRSYDVAVPICSQSVLWSEGAWLDRGTVWWLNVIGRLKPGGSVQNATARLAAMSPGMFEATLPKDYPAENVKDYLKFKLSAVPGGYGVSFLREQYADSLSLLLGTAGLVLLIACANLANLMLARATAREHEFAVRLAIGAPRGRLIQQLLTESLLLAVAGGAFGLFLARALSQFLVASLATQGDPLFLDLKLDWRLLSFMFGIATLACILFGLAPGLRAARVSPSEAFKTNTRSVAGSGNRFGLRQVLVISQVALSLVLVVGGVLFSGTLRKLLAVDPGFRQEGVLKVDLDLFRRLTVPKSERNAFKRDLLNKIRALPGVVAAGEVYLLPLGGASSNNRVWIEGSNRTSGMGTFFNWVGDGYFRSLGISLLAGRDFDDHDTVTSPKVAIVNETLVRKLGLGPNPIGRKFRREATPGEPEGTYEVVGLVRDTKYGSLREPFEPIVFLCTAQDFDPDPAAQVVILSAAPMGQTVSNVRNIVAQTSPLITVDFIPFKTTILDGLMQERLMAKLSGFFGILASLIAAVGLYGVMSYVAARRTNEIGVRMALGAQKRNILTLILREAGLLLIPGLILGAILGIAAAQAARSMLFGLKPADPGTLICAIIGLGLVALLASYIPARRAANLDPMRALREE